MKRFWGLPIVAAVLAAGLAENAEAGYCGAARFRCCAPACDAGQQCHTVMRTVRQTVYEPQQFTTYRDRFG